MHSHSLLYISVLFSLSVVLSAHFCAMYDPEEGKNGTWTYEQMNGHCIRVVFHGVYHSPKISGISNKNHFYKMHFSPVKV